ncbi:MAG: hypothetical protein IMF19_12010, partial [Proteobacteria bacterium]|nr:hypothetical protein [Pseudomonadota bacterium]
MDKIIDTSIEIDKDGRFIHNLNFNMHLDTDLYTDWIFQTQMLEKCKIRNGEVVYVEDGDTIDISPVEGAYIQRIRLVG